MFRLSKLADYGIVLLACFTLRRPEANVATGEPAAGNGADGDDAGSPCSATELAEQTGLPLPTVSKILKLLARAGVLESVRGARGGYRLMRPAREVPLTDVITALDGPIAMTECCSQESACGCNIETSCPVRINWQRINVAVHAALSSIMLAEMIEDQAPGFVQRASSRLRVAPTMAATTDDHAD